MSYKYKLAYATRKQAAKPTKIGSLVVAREEDEAFFRTKLTGSVEFVGADFDFLEEAKKYAVSCCQDIAFTILRDCVETGEAIVWEGHFVLDEVDYDFDNKTASVQKIAVRDDYTEILGAWSKEVNIMQMEPRIRIMLNAGRGTTDPDYNPTGTNYYDRGIDLIESLRYLIRQTLRLSSRQEQVSRQALSSFLSAAVNPVTGRTNIFNDVVLMHLSDAKRPGATNPARTAKISLKGMLKGLKEMFNLYWYIDPETGFVRIEHVSFFPHLTYTPAPVSLDLTQDHFKEKLKGKNAYSNDNSQLFGTEGLEIQLNAYDPVGVYDVDSEYDPDGKYTPPAEFAKVYYLFSNECVPTDAKGEKTEGIKTSTLFFTDILAARVFPAALADEGWALVEAPMINRIRTIREVYTPLTNLLVHNGNLSASALFRDYHRYFSSFNYGYLSATKDIAGRPVPSKSIKNTRVFPDIDLAYCCGDNYDFSGAIKHPLAARATVEKLEYNLDTDNVTVSLVAARECKDVPVSEPEQHTPETPDNGCKPHGTFLRKDQQLHYCPGNVRKLHSETTTEYYADGACGEFTTGGVTTIIKDC